LIVAVPDPGLTPREVRAMGRKVADCRDTPSDIGCTLTIAGEEEEVVRAAVEHAVSAHSESDTLELRAAIRDSLKDEEPGYGFGESPSEAYP
jgi:predicted small metal-binding protein